MPTSGKPNVLILWGDDIGWWNISYNNRGQMGYRTPNIDRIGNEGATFTDYYGQQSCTAGRAAFITGQNPIRTGLTKVGMPGADVGLRAEDPTIAELLKPLGYATGQFGKNHLGDKDEFLPTAHGFDEFFGNLYHLNAEEEPEDPDYPKDPAFKKRFGPRGVLHSWADGKGGQKIEDTGPLTKKRMETIDDEVTEHALSFIDKTHTRKESPSSFGTTQPPCTSGPTARKSTRARAARATTTTSWSPTTRTSARCWPSSTSSASPTTPSSCTRLTTVRTTIAGPTPALPRSAARRTPTGKAAGACRSFVRWPGKIKPGSVFNDVASHQDWLPTSSCRRGRRGASRRSSSKATPSATRPSRCTSTATTCCPI